MNTVSKESTARGALALELLLGTLTAFAPLSINMYLPARSREAGAGEGSEVTPA
ncbi:hypothetical protein [Myxococcus sp. RHSTA-1-4]|uniref:hypothetical protein n=1 Tax=Myxococcus sp. RHSTA-1-4 TaxID=2874601 RepID=UPI001CBE4DD4|nr:hypothetical protein [Myxococcus sp. RHSTA-1-4]MBZ4419080.1 hypothetical protein [Myxococcus sp. RHSTA-1-4]